MTNDGADHAGAWRLGWFAHECGEGRVPVPPGLEALGGDAEWLAGWDARHRDVLRGLAIAAGADLQSTTKSEETR